MQVRAQSTHDRVQLRVCLDAQDRRLFQLENANGHSEEHFLAVEKEPVPHPQRGLRGQRAHKGAEEPVQSDQMDLDAAVCQMSGKFRKLALDKPLEDELIDLRAHHRVRVVVGRQKRWLHHGTKQPEGIFLAHEQQHHAHDEVHGLAVPDRWVVQRVGTQHVLELAFPTLALFTDTHSLISSRRLARVGIQAVCTWKNACSGYVRQRSFSISQRDYGTREHSCRWAIVYGQQPGCP